MESDGRRQVFYGTYNTCRCAHDDRAFTFLDNPDTNRDIGTIEATGYAGAAALIPMMRATTR